MQIKNMVFSHLSCRTTVVSPLFDLTRVEDSLDTHEAQIRAERPHSFDA